MRTVTIETEGRLIVMRATHRSAPVAIALAALAVAAAQPNAAPGHARILSDQAVPRSLGPYGGLVTVQADVRNALSCQLKVKSAQGFAVAYSHAPSYHCQSGYFTANVRVGANPSNVPRTLVFAIRVANATSSATGLVPLKVEAKPKA